MAGSDTLVLMPTGGGKSLCYQVPALALEGMALVVTPLVSLMTDQVLQLRKRGIEAVAVHSGMPRQEVDITLTNAVSGLYKLLYVSPERLKSRTFIERFKLMRVSLIAVDEAHCISQWGHDFRPPYLDIADIRAYHPHVPMVALTATATPQVADDIKRSLHLAKPNIFRTPYIRENLSFVVLREGDKVARLANVIKKSGGSSIVYVRSRQQSVALAGQLRQLGIGAESYHAGLSARERDKRQRAWLKEEVPCMVATNAFGMGIDKGNVRCVVHLDIPPSPEEYYQEAGRAGRDGKKSYAVLLYDDKDLEKLDYFIEAEFPPLPFIRNVYNALGNYYQVPIGAGGDTQYPFDYEKVCSTYGFDTVSFYSAVRILQHEGLLDLPDLSHSLSTLFIPVSRETLYSFQLGHPQYSELIATLLRTYGGLFTSYVPISEQLIARHMYLTSHLRVIAALQDLNSKKIVSYRLRSDKPRLVFTMPRRDAADLQISPQHYALLRRRAEERKHTMVQYVTAREGCRSAMLRTYFGDSDIARCGICDLCLAASRAAGDKETTQQRIVNAIARQGATTLPALSNLLSDVPRDELGSHLRRLVDSGTISYDPATGSLQISA